MILPIVLIADFDLDNYGKRCVCIFNSIDNVFFIFVDMVFYMIFNVFFIRLNLMLCLRLLNL